MASVPKAQAGNPRQDLYRRIEKHNFAPLWEVYHDLIPHPVPGEVLADHIQADHDHTDHVHPTEAQNGRSA